MFGGHFLQIYALINLPCGHDVRSYTKFGPDRFSPFDVYWKKNENQNKQSISIEDIFFILFLPVCVFFYVDFIFCYQFIALLLKIHSCVHCLVLLIGQPPDEGSVVIDLKCRF